MRRFISYLFTILSLGASVTLAEAQETAPEYQKKLNSLYRYSVPVIQPSDLSLMIADGEEVIILDTRTTKEYKVSHLPNARFVDFDKFSKKDVNALDKSQKVVVYCTVGYRSERIGEKLQKLGFSDVSNLYGGILEWKNQGNEVVDPKGRETQEVHTYSKSWGKWLQDGAGKKVY